MRILLIAPDDALWGFLKKHLDLNHEVIDGKIVNAAELTQTHNCETIVAGLSLDGENTVSTLLDSLISAGSETPLLILSSQLGHQVSAGYRQAEYYDGLHNHKRSFSTSIIHLWGTRYCSDSDPRKIVDHEPRVRKQLDEALAMITTGAPT